MSVRRRPVRSVRSVRPGEDHPLRVITGTGPPDDTAMWAPKPVTDEPEQDGPALYSQL